MTNQINLTEYERRVEVRPLAVEDFQALVEMQLACFPRMKPWKLEQIESQLRVFPEGQIVVTVDGQLAGSSASLIVSFDLYSDWHDWKKLSDSGYIRNHDPRGDTLYGIEIMIAPAFRNMKLARRLYDARKQLCRAHNLERIVIGGRLPGYSAVADQMAPAEYVERVTRGELHDPVLTMQLANGFVIERLIPDYMPSDEESAGWATHMEWNNLDATADDGRVFQPVQKVRIAAVQWQMRRVATFVDFAQQARFFVDVASDYRCDFVLFPELFTLQLLSLAESGRPGQAARQLAAFTPQYLELFQSLAVQYNVNIIGGSQFVVENSRLFNIAYLFRRNGTLEKQYKLHITPSERKWWGVEGGAKLEVFETDRGRIAINVCYDVEFPELARVAARKGAQLLFVPFNTDQRQGYLRVRYCAQARAIENHLAVIISGCTGNLPSVENADIHYAQSGIFVPCDVSFARDGIANECQPNVETVVMSEVDLEQLRHHRAAGSTTNWNDRRRDLYELSYRGGDEPEII